MRLDAFLASLVLVVGCSSTSTTLDGGCLVADAGFEAGDAGFIYTPMNPPHAPEHACTSQQLGDYAQCQAMKNTSLCTQFQQGGTSAACSACMESQSTDPTWGVLVFVNQQTTASFNIEGCVDLALGRPAPPNPSCGDLLHASYECQNQATATLCSTCVGDAAACQETVLVTACATQNDAVLDPSGPCGPLFSDAASAAALACFPDPAIKDPQTQEADWLTRVGAIFCGP